MSDTEHKEFLALNVLEFPPDSVEYLHRTSGHAVYSSQTFMREGRKVAILPSEDSSFRQESLAGDSISRRKGGRALDRVLVRARSSSLPASRIAIHPENKPSADRKAKEMEELLYFASVIDAHHVPAVGEHDPIDAELFAAVLKFAKPCVTTVISKKKIITLRRHLRYSKKWKYGAKTMLEDCFGEGLVTSAGRIAYEPGAVVTNEEYELEQEALRHPEAR